MRLLAGLLIILAPTQASADSPSVWQRAAHPESARERQLLRALARTLEGTGDARDLTTIRAAFVDLARGHQYRDQSVTVLLLRVRSELGRELGVAAEAQLRLAVERRLPPTIEALAALELGKLLEARGASGEGERWLKRAASCALRDEARGEALLLLALFSKRRGALEAARDFLSRATALELTGAQLSYGYRLQAALAAQQGNLPEARVFLQRGRAVSQWRATASGRAVTEGWPLTELEQAEILGLEKQLLAEEAEAP